MYLKYKVYVTATCRKCGKEEEFNFVPEDLANIEVDAHEIAEDANWTDTLCPRCAKEEHAHD